MQPIKTDTEQRIVDAAVQLFSRQGFNGTSTREIARLADVNEGTLFRHFARKIDLFWAAVESRLSRIRMGRDLQTSLANDDVPEVVLPKVLEFLVATVVHQPEAMRLLFRAMEVPGAHGLYRKHLGTTFEAVSGYLGRSALRGTIRNVDPMITTFGIASSVIAHQQLYEVVTGNELPYASLREALSSYTVFWLDALRMQPALSRAAQLPS